MLNMNAIMKQLQMDSETVTAEVIQKLIKENASNRDHLVNLYKAYRGECLPIQARPDAPINKANNKLSNDFRGEIVDQVTGYLFGNPVTYSLKPDVDNNETKESDSYKKKLQVLKDFNRVNRIDEVDFETGKFMSIEGWTARLLYIDKNGKERVMNVPPYECIFIYDETGNELKYALRYYNIYDVSKGVMKSRTRVEWYDQKEVTYYISNTKGDAYQADCHEAIVDGEIMMVHSQRHFFNGVPLIEFENNTELLGDFKKTEALIDAYDRVTSDSQNELEDLRQAYLVFKGVTVDGPILAEAKKTGAFGINEDDAISYLTKELNDAYVENQKNTLMDNIYRFSKTVDVKADTFTGSGASGEARKWLLLALENRGATKERKFKSGVLDMNILLTQIWAAKGVKIDPYLIEVELDRNLPVELKLEAEIQAALMGTISNRTRLKQLSVVKDVDEELRTIAEENEDNIDLDDVNIDDEEGGDDEGKTQAEAEAEAKRKAAGGGE